MATSVIILGALALSSGADYFDDYFDVSGAARALPVQAQRAKVGAGNLSPTWAGEVALGAPGTFNSVSAEWTEPAVQCSSAHEGVSIWVGIGGLVKGAGLEQVGTHAICTNGAVAYSAFTEILPAPAATLPGVQIHAGDRIRASVERNGQTFTMTLTNVTTRQHGTVTAVDPSGAAITAEAIVERISEGTDVDHATPLGLPNFGTVTLSHPDIQANGPAQLIGLAMSDVTYSRILAETITQGSKLTVTWKASS